MSLLDTLGSLFGKSPPQAGGPQALVPAALELINNQPGGLHGLIQQFEENGAGGIIRSWVSNGENQPISADELQNVVGSDAIAAMAQKLGMQPNEVSGKLSQVLPHIVNVATPDGQVPAEGKLNAESVLGALGGLASLFGKDDKSA
jgi:uncharacterized protein YidB (DUF937 family)